jgi:hypothetical protein
MPTQTPHPYNVSTNICHVTLFIDRNNSIIDEEYDGSTLQVIIRSIPQICSNNFTLRVQGVLKRVIITNSITNCSGVYISWERPQSVPCVQILHYTISVPELHYTYNTDNEHIMIHSDILLVSDTQYTVNIRAVNEVGYSNDSTIIINWSNSTCSNIQFSSINSQPIDSISTSMSQMVPTSTSDFTTIITNTFSYTYNSPLSPSSINEVPSSIGNQTIVIIILGIIIGVMGLVIIILVAVIIKLIRKNKKLKRVNLNSNNIELNDQTSAAHALDNYSKQNSLEEETKLKEEMKSSSSDIPSDNNLDDVSISHSSDIPNKETSLYNSVSEQNSLKETIDNAQSQASDFNLSSTDDVSQSDNKAEKLQRRQSIQSLKSLKPALSRRRSYSLVSNEEVDDELGHVDSTFSEIHENEMASDADCLYSED